MTSSREQHSSLFKSIVSRVSHLVGRAQPENKVSDGTCPSPSARKHAREVAHTVGHYLAAIGGASRAGMPVCDDNPKTKLQRRIDTYGHLIDYRSEIVSLTRPSR